MVASLMCVPVAHAFSSDGDALSRLWTIVKSWNVALPAPAPPPAPELTWAFVTPHENESTSISSLCLLSRDSPLMSPIFAKMSDAIARSSTIRTQRLYLIRRLRGASFLKTRHRPQQYCARGQHRRASILRRYTSQSV